MGNTRNTGYLQNIVQYDASNNITLPARLAVTGTVAVNNTTPYDTTQFSLDVNGGLIVKNINKTAQFVLINSNPATGGNNAFVVHTVGGTSGSSYADIQGYYGTSIAGSTVIRLNPQGGNVLVGSLIGTGSRMVVTDATGVLSSQAIPTLGELSGVPTSRTLTIDGVSYDLSANRTWSVLPTGGAAGQLLAKSSATNYATEWIDNYTSEVKHYVKLAENISIGTAVYISGSTGQAGTNMLVSKASNASEGTSSKTLGLVAFTGVTNDIGFVVTEGLLEGLDTSTAGAVGDPVWLGVNGALIFGLANKPIAPAHLVFIGVVTRKQQNNGEIFVKVQNGFEFGELHDYVQTGVLDNYVISYESSTSLYKPKSIATLLGYTPANAARTITINGTSYDLSADRSWTINSMIYPGAGIAVSTGTAWGTSLTNNSSNWNTAYGWGNHASAGYATTTYVGTQIANLVASSPATLDTLNELAAALGNDAAFSTTVSTALGNRLRVDTASQGLSATLQGYGRTNLGLGTAATANTGDFVAYRTFGTAANNNTGDFAAASHTHSIANVTGLQTALDGKQASGSYAAATHSHIISDVTGLQTALDGKQASLGFTPYNSTNPSGYITGYTETDTLASVTGRGATTSTAITISNTLTVGSTLYANTGNEYLRNTAGAVNNAQFQTWFNSAGTRRGYFGYGSGGSNTLELNNESGGQVLINGGDFIANANYFRMKGSGGAAEFVWYKDYSGSPSEPGFVINNRAGATTFYHNANGGGTGVSGSFTAAGAISASNFSGSHSGTSSGTNTGDQIDINGNAATSTTTGSVQGRSRGSFTIGGNTSTFYPVSFGIGSGSTSRQGIAVIQIERGGYDDPGYTGYTFSTFHCRIRAKADGWGYGASYVQVEANAYTVPMLADVSQQNQTSELIVWLRGGSRYNWFDLEGTAGLNFGNPSGTSYTTFSGASVFNSTTTNNIGSNFKYQAGWGDNFISGRLTAASAVIGSMTSPSANLNVAYSIAVRANLSGTEQQIFHIGNTGSGVNDGYMRLFDSGTTKVLIAANNARGGDTYFNGGGNFGINTDAPSSKLEVFSGSTTADALTLSFTTGADNRQTGIFFKGGPYPYARIVGGTSSYGPDQGFIAFYTNYNPSGAASTSGYCLERVRINPNGSIVATGDITAFGSPSDIKLKNIKEVVPNALQSILKLNGYRFDWKDVNHLTKIKEDIGVVAQEVEKVLPELARTNDDGTMSVRYQGLTAVLIEAMKEQQTQIESQKSEIDELKDLVKQLINR